MPNNQPFLHIIRTSNYKFLITLYLVYYYFINRKNLNSITEIPVHLYTVTNNYTKKD